MNANQVRLLAFIAELERQHGKAHPRVRSIAGALGVSERAIQYHLRTLRSTGLVKVSSRRTRGGKQLTSRYRLTEAGKAVVASASPMKQQNAAFAAFHTENEGGGVNTKFASPVNGVNKESASPVKRLDALGTTSSALEPGGGVNRDSASPLTATSPLNKEHQEPAGGGPDPAAPEGRPQRPQPRLTGIPEVDSYILRKHKERENAPPDPYAWMHERHAQKLHEQHLAIMANRNKADA